MSSGSIGRCEVISITVEGESPIGKMLADIKSPAPMWRDIAHHMEAEFQKELRPHIKTGVMYRNIYSESDKNSAEAGIRDNNMLVTTKRGRVNYGVFLDQGTRDHPIAPRKKRALRWVAKNGRFAFSKGHRVRGIKAIHFMDKIREDSYNYAVKKIKETYKGLN